MSAVPVIIKASASSPYVRLFELASGGMGAVHLALRQQGQFRRVYAMKTMHPHFRGDADLRRMFLAEAEVAGSVHHPNVVPVLDVGVQPATGPYIIMPYVESVTLRKVCADARWRQQALPLPMVLALGASIARGLHAIHTARSVDGQLLRVVHRDVSPHNLLLGFDGIARITDLGIAKVREHVRQTDTGVLKGKMAYMPPESLRFEPVTPRSDIFSLGVVLSEMVLNERLFAGANATAAHQILHEPSPHWHTRCPTLPVELALLLDAMLAKNPEDRPASAEQVVGELEALLSHLPRPPELGPWLDARFSEERQELAQRVEDAVGSASAVRASASTALVAESTDETRVAAVSAAPQRGASNEMLSSTGDSSELDAVPTALPKRARRAAFIITAAALALAGGSALYVLRAADESPVPVEEATVVQEMAVGPDASSSDAGETHSQPQPAEAPVHALAEDATLTVEKPSAAVVAPPSPRRRGRRARGRRPHSTAESLPPPAMNDPTSMGLPADDIADTFRVP